MRTLVIIDMQEEFMGGGMPVASETKIIENITLLIHEFGQKKWPIIVVQFDGHGLTIKSLVNVLLQYEKRVKVINKNCQDGSKEVLQHINRMDWPTDIVMTGIYGDQCVPATAGGIVNRNNKAIVDIVRECIWPDWYPGDYDLNRIQLINQEKVNG